MAEGFKAYFEAVTTKKVEYSITDNCVVLTLMESIFIVYLLYHVGFLFLSQEFLDSEYNYITSIQEESYHVYYAAAEMTVLSII